VPNLLTFAEGRWGSTSQLLATSVDATPLAVCVTDCRRQ